MPRKRENTPEGPDKISVSAAWKQVVATPPGLIVIQDLLRRFGYTRKSTVNLNNPDAMLSHYAEGQRSVMVYIGIMVDGQEIEPTEDEPQEDTE